MLNVLTGPNMPDDRVDYAAKRRRNRREQTKRIASDMNPKKGDRILIVFDGSDEDIQQFIEKANNAGAEVMVEFTPPRQRRRTNGQWR